MYMVISSRIVNTANRVDFPIILRLKSLEGCFKRKYSHLLATFAQLLWDVLYISFIMLITDREIVNFAL